MGMLKKDFKYKIVHDFLNETEINICRHYLNIKHKINFNEFDDGQMASSTCDSHWYADPLTEAMLVMKRKKMEKETGLELFPSYSYSRVYTHGAILEKHTDREACEVSVTVCVGSSGEEWPIYMDGTEINLKPGDAAIYLGCEVEHWREEFKGDYHMQFFLHYVDKNDKFKDFIFDERPLLGLQKN